jgi:hypothetical protein
VKITDIAQINRPLFSAVTATYVVIFTKNGLGFTLGDFFTNASGHPGCRHLDKTQRSQPSLTSSKRRKNLPLHDWCHMSSLSERRIYDSSLAGIILLTNFEGRNFLSRSRRRRKKSELAKNIRVA